MPNELGFILLRHNWITEGYLQCCDSAWLKQLNFCSSHHLILLKIFSIMALFLNCTILPVQKLLFLYRNKAIFHRSWFDSRTVTWHFWLRDTERQAGTNMEKKQGKKQQSGMLDAGWCKYILLRDSLSQPLHLGCFYNNRCGFSFPSSSKNCATSILSGLFCQKRENWKEIFWALR